mgnify:CR=1 FL=1
MSQSECISALMVIAYFNFSGQIFEHDESGILSKLRHRGLKLDGAIGDMGLEGF